jgi:hypothetical protein
MLIPRIDQATHRYTVDGKPVPSVTQVITSCMGSNPFWTQEARDLGSAVHMAIRFDADGDLDESQLATEIRPYLDAYEKFRAELQFTPDLIEQPLYHLNPLYCGMPDQANTKRCVVDFKTGAFGPEHAIQLAAYAHLLFNPFILERWAVYLSEDGKYSMKVFPKSELSSDWNVFQHMLAIHNWKGNHGK